MTKDTVSYIYPPATTTMRSRTPRTFLAAVGSGVSAVVAAMLLHLGERLVRDGLAGRFELRLRLDGRGRRASGRGGGRCGFGGFVDGPGCC